jgi:ribosome-associated protein
MHHDTESEEEYILSRTEKKKSMQVFVDLGSALLALSKKQLSAIPLSNEVLDALNVAKKISVGNALKRQLSFIAKQIRKSDYERIQAALEELQQKDNLYDKVSKKAEQWRDRLLTEEPNALSDFITQYHSSDRQKLAQVTRNAVKEKKQQEKNSEEGNNTNTSNKYKKQLFTLLRVHIAEQH